jgi:hypothetical protein
MPLPEYPDALEEAAWKKITGTSYAALEKDLGIGGSLKLMKKVFADINGDTFTKLETAIEEQDGDEVKANYALLDQEFPKIEKFARLAGEYNKTCAAEGARLIKAPATKKVGEWLVKSGKACVDYGKEMDTFGEELLDKATALPTEKLVPFQRDLTEWNLATLLTRTLGLKVQMIRVPDDIPVTITITGTAGKEMEENVTLLQEFYDAAFDEGKKHGALLKVSLEKIDQDVLSGKLATAAAQAQVRDACAKFKAGLETSAPVAVVAVWTAYQKEHEEYRTYQIRAGLKMGASITGLAVSVATTATTGWTGVGTIAGVIGMIKSVAAIGSQIYDLWKEATEVGNEVDEIIKTLIKRYQDESKNLVGAKELGAKAVSELTGYQMDSIPKAEDKLKLFNNKLKGLHVTAVGSGADLKACLTEYDALKKKLSKLVGALENAPKARQAVEKVQKIILEHEKSINTLIKLIAGRMETYKTGTESAAQYDEAIKILNGQVAEWSKITQKYAVPLLGLVGAADLQSAIEKSIGAAAQIGAAALEAEEALETANNAKEIVGNIKDLVELFKVK